MIHLYENHLTGGYYTLDRYNEYLLETCETCGDRDWYVGEYRNMKEVALKMYEQRASDEHIAEVTGLKVKVSFEEVE